MFKSIFRKKVSQPVRISRLGKFWNWLTEANASIKDFGERRSASLAASFLLVIAIFDITGGLARTPRLGLVEAFSGPIGLTILPIFLAYVLSRTKWYRAGIFIFALGFSALAYVTMISQRSQADMSGLLFIYIPLSLIIASTFISAWATVLLTVLNLVAFFLTGNMIHRPDNFWALFGITLTLGIVLVVLSYFRNNIEKYRLDELKQINKELDNAKVNLEQRVIERTQAMATVAEIGSITSTILETDKLLQQAVNLTKERFNLYHSGIYLLDEASQNLVLTAGSGEAGSQMMAKGISIPLAQKQSLIARAARERKGVIVNDVTQAPDFLPESLLLDTRSELVVPMIIGQNVIGVFDVQSDTVNRFSDADINVQTTLASQLAISVQNARLYTQAENSKQEAQSLVDYASEAILILNMETGLFNEPNESAVNLFGLPREELVKFGPAQLSPPKQPDGRDSTEKTIEVIGKALQGQAQVFDWTYRNAQGRDIFCELRLVKIPGTHPRLRATITDISERKRAEGLFRQRAQQQEALNLITQKIQGATTVEAALQIATRELGHVLGMKPTFVTLDPADLTGERESKMNGEPAK